MDFDAPTLLADRMRLLQDMQRRLSHDLRGPLNALSLNVDLLVASLEPSADEGQRRYLATLRRDLARLLTDLERTMSRLRIWEHRREAIDLKELLGETLQLLAGAARAGGVQLESSLPAAPLRFTGYRDAIAHVMLLLTWRAIDAASRGDRLVLDLAPRQGRICLQWRMAGGASAGGVGAEAGSGASRAGFEVAREIVADHGGQLEVPGGSGAWAVVTLPADER